MFVDISDLNYVLTKLEQFPKHRWKEFGLKCGLYHNTLEGIEYTYARSPSFLDECFRETVVRWLKKEDNVRLEGEPTFLKINDIVEAVIPTDTGE